MRSSWPEHLATHPGLSRTYRPNVAAVIVNAADQILWCERCGMPGTWQFPQGGIDPGESAEEALWRELHEELGLAAPRAHLVIEQVLTSPIRYDFPVEVIEAFLDRRGHSHVGQAQSYFRLRWTGDDALLTLEPPPGESREFSAWCWSDSRLLSATTPFKRAAMTEALRALRLAP